MTFDECWEKDPDKAKFNYMQHIDVLRYKEQFLGYFHAGIRYAGQQLRELENSYHPFLSSPYTNNCAICGRSQFEPIHKGE